MNSKPVKSWLPFAILAAALLGWAVLFAAGTYLEPSADQPKHDIRKPLFVLGGMLLFLGLWGIALWFRAGRSRK